MILLHTVFSRLPVMAMACMITTTGNTRTNTRVSLATKLFSVATEKMIWSATTESFNPSSARTVSRELEALVIGDMQKSGVLK